MKRAYKFLSANWATEAVKKRRLKISHLSTLNDPWDFRPLKFSDPVRQKPAWEKVLSMISQDKGVVCFSKTWDEPVHWSHYGDNHAGIALGFDLLEKTPDGVKTYVEVEYIDQLIQFPGELFPLVAPRPEGEEMITRIISSKYEKWSYEEEVRFFANMEEPDPESDLFFLNFGTDCILREIIFGARYRDSEQMSAILAGVRSDPKVECWKAALGNESFRLIKDPQWTWKRS